jgi:hypothetical protein
VTDRASPERLAAALSAGLAPVLPPEFEVSYEQDRVRVALRGTPRWSEAHLDWALEAGGVAFALEHALDDFQDFIARELTEPWPAGAPHASALPFARIENDRALAGYGLEPAPVLPLAPIALQDLR